jgi:hypothetical protein
MAFQIPYTSKQPVTDFSLPFATTKYATALTAATDTPLTVPASSNRWIAVMKCTAVPDGVWVSYNAAFTEPTFAALTSAELVCECGTAREVVAGDILHFYTAGTGASVSVELYSYLVNN